ncbi:hypothetical protein BLNAU_22021 [Blattamonas nauphoetae]|uniref:Uncharacterized protein n=1 Tax=Blattamonas nauphoetae TaxID=2049346 RepID=A0ABQ9WWG6_9EUKA|nr:hypothetical protein BLNAU_22021 [Blattamonas nauphoetae]
MDSCPSTINDTTIEDWEDACPELVQFGKRMIQALFSEGFEDTLEQMLMPKGGHSYYFNVPNESHSIL